MNETNKQPKKRPSAGFQKGRGFVRSFLHNPSLIPALFLLAAVCLAAAAIATALPIKARGSVLLAILAASGAGLGMGQGLEELTLITGGLIGLAAGLVVASVHYLFGEYSDSDAALPSLAGALIAVAVSGVPVYILGRVLLHMP